MTENGVPSGNQKLGICGDLSGQDYQAYILTTEREKGDTNMHGNLGSGEHRAYMHLVRCCGTSGLFGICPIESAQDFGYVVLCYRRFVTCID